MALGVKTIAPVLESRAMPEEVISGLAPESPPAYTTGVPGPDLQGTMENTRESPSTSTAPGLYRDCWFTQNIAAGGLLKVGELLQGLVVLSNRASMYMFWLLGFRVVIILFRQHKLHPNTQSLPQPAGKFRIPV